MIYPPFRVSPPVLGEAEELEPLEKAMTCQDLAQRIAQLHPGLAPSEVAQLCLLVLRTAEAPASLAEPATLEKSLRAASFRLDAASDQYAAMSAELEAIFGAGPVRFSADQIWTLLRAVKVQTQLLELYAGTPAMA